MYPRRAVGSSISLCYIESYETWASFFQSCARWCKHFLQSVRLFGAGTLAKIGVSPSDSDARAMIKCV
jgi:hypothetical protein